MSSFGAAMLLTGTATLYILLCFPWSVVVDYLCYGSSDKDRRPLNSWCMCTSRWSLWAGATPFSNPETQGSKLCRAVFITTLMTALFCRGLYESLLRPTLKLRFTWRRHPRLFWVVMFVISTCLTRSFTQLDTRLSPSWPSVLQSSSIRLQDALCRFPQMAHHSSRPFCW